MKKTEIERILTSLKVSIPTEVEKELLEQYGSYVSDNDGHEFQYTEQDIYEQLRKRLRQYKKLQSQLCQFLADSLSYYLESKQNQGGGLPC